VIQGESRLAVIYTLKNDIPLNRITNFPESDYLKLESANVRTAKGLMASSPEMIASLVTDTEVLRKLAIKALFP
jgi:hypothetical protein